MTPDAALDAFRDHAKSPATLRLWGTNTPTRNFDTVREALLFLADKSPTEPLPALHIHAVTGDLAINDPDLERLIAAARARRSAT